MTGMKRMCRGLLPIAALLMCLLLSVSCKTQEADWKKTLHDAGKTLHITYDGNGGLFDKYEKLDVYIAPGDPIPQVETTPSLNEPIRNGYFVGAWYYASYDADGKLVLSDRQVDFADCAASEDTVIAPKWEQNFELRFLAGDGETVAMSYRVKPGDSYDRPTSAPEKEGYTFLGSYRLSDADCPGGGQSIRTPLTYAEILAADGDGDRVVTLCPEFIENEGGVPWVIVSEPDELYEGTNYYLTADLDFSGKTISADEWGYRFLGTNGLIEGNGHTIRGLHITATAKANITSYGVFPAGSVKTVRNLHFADCTLEVTFSSRRVSGPGFLVGFLSGDTDGMELTRVRFEGCLLKIAHPDAAPPQYGVLVGNEEADVKLDGETVTPGGTVDGLRVELTVN